MAKLKCDLHKERVLAVNGKFIHRSGFSSICESPTATIGGMTYTAQEIKDAEALRTESQKKGSWLQLRKDNSNA